MMESLCQVTSRTQTQHFAPTPALLSVQFPVIEENVDRRVQDCEKDSLLSEMRRSKKRPLMIAEVNIEQRNRRPTKSERTRCNQGDFLLAEKVEDRGFVMMSNLFPELLHVSMAFLDPEEANSLLVAPLCRSFYNHVTCNQLLWRAMCASEPWRIPVTHMDGLCLCVLTQERARRDGEGHQVVAVADNSTATPVSLSSLSSRLLDFPPVPSFGSSCDEHLRPETPPVAHSKCGRPACAALALRREHSLLAWDLKRVRKVSSVSASHTGGVHSASAAAATAADVKAAYLDRKGGGGCGLCPSECFGGGGSAVQQRQDLPTPGERPQVQQQQVLVEGVALIAEVMLSHPLVVGMQAVCLSALLPLLEAEPVRRQAQDSPLGYAVVAALRNFTDRVDVQNAALHALVLLARPLGGKEGTVHVGLAPALPCLLGSQGGIRCVLECCMDRHPLEGGLQAMACWTLVNFALNGEAKRLLLAQGGLSRILKAMTAHKTHLAVQFRGLFALINLVVPEQPNTPAPHLEEVLECVLSAMETFMDDDLLVNRGCLVLQNLSLNEHNHECLRRSRARGVLAESMARHQFRDSMLELSARATSLRIWPQAPATQQTTPAPVN